MRILGVTLLLLATLAAWLTAWAKAAEADPLADAKAAYLRGDFATALPILNALQKQDVAEAQFYLGEMFRRGEGVAKDPGRAVALYRQASSKGFPNAETELGIMYTVGSGVPLNVEEAFSWFQRAAVQGYGPAQSFLGTAYLEGQGTRVDATTAAQWLTASAEREVPSGQYVLASLYLRGLGVEKNLSRALAWLKICASNASNADTPESDDLFRALSRKKAEILAASMRPADISKADDFVRRFRPMNGN
jgi:TPR repeat protein